jgi:hypothetical protein
LRFCDMVAGDVVLGILDITVYDMWVERYTEVGYKDGVERRLLHSSS